MGEKRGIYRVLVRKPEGKKSFGRTRCIWVDNIKIDLQELGCGCMDWIDLPQYRTRGGRNEHSCYINKGKFLTS